MSRPTGIALLALSCACGETVPPPVAPVPPEATPAAPPAPASPPASAVTPEETAPLPFATTWSAQTTPFHEAIALSPAGALALLSSRRLRLVDAASGELFAEREVCFGLPGGVGFVDEGTLALVCERSVRLFSVPGLELRGERPLGGEVRLAGFGAGKLAVAYASGAIELSDARDGANALAFRAGEAVTALAIAPGASAIAVGLASGAVMVRRGANEARLPLARGIAPAAVAFSPDGALLFAAAGPRAVAFGADGSEAHVFHGLAGVSSARWVGAREIAVASSDGLLLLDLDGAVKSLPPPLGTAAAPRALALSADARQLCGGERDGLVACLRRGAAAPVAIELAPRDDGQRRLAGRVIFAEGARLRVQALPDSPLPPEHAVVAIEHFDTKLGATRWIEIASARSESIDDDVVELQLEGGKAPAEPLAYDAPVRLAWPAR